MTLSDRRKIIFFIVLIAVAVLAAVYWRFNPEESSFFPKCIFKTVTGYECPGCGTQRAIHELLKGNLCRALRYNALAVISLPYILFGILSSIYEWKSCILIRLRDTLFSARAGIVIVVIILIFWILRNIL